MDTILKTAQTLGVAIAEILLAIYFCKQYINSVVGKINISDGVKEQNKIDMGLVSKMDYYKELLGADRILLFEFHNGQHYSNYRNALKMSVSYEVYRAGLESTRNACSNLPISIMPKFIAGITQEGEVSCHDIEEIKHDMGNSYEFKKELGVRAFYDMAIHDLNGNVVGFVAVQWNKPQIDFDIENIKHLTWYLEEAVNQLTMMDKKQKRKFFTKKK